MEQVANKANLEKISHSRPIEIALHPRELDASSRLHSPRGNVST